MSWTRARAIVMIAALFGVPAAFAVQEAPPAEKPAPAAEKPASTNERYITTRGTPLRLQIVFARYQGDTKLSSLPYTLALNSDERPSRVRMGIQVPIQMKDTPGQMSYRDVGNNLDCSAGSSTDGRFRVACVLEQSSVYTTGPDRPATQGNPPISSLPILRTFRAEAALMLRDGQTGQYTTATDPVSGEVLKIDMTLHVVK
jgi:hypothetical protein